MAARGRGTEVEHTASPTAADPAPLRPRTNQDAQALRMFGRSGVIDMKWAGFEWLVCGMFLTIPSEPPIDFN